MPPHLINSNINRRRGGGPLKSSSLWANPLSGAWFRLGFAWFRQSLLGRLLFDAVGSGMWKIHSHANSLGFHTALVWTWFRLGFAWFRYRFLIANPFGLACVGWALFYTLLCGVRVSPDLTPQGP